MQLSRRTLKHLSVYVGVSYLVMLLLSYAVFLRPDRFLDGENVAKEHGAIQVVLKSQNNNFHVSKNEEYEGEGDLSQAPEALRLPYPPVNNVSEDNLNNKSKHQDEGNINIEEAFIQAREKVYQERRARVMQVCRDLAGNVSYGSLAAAPLTRLRWLTSHKLIMCFNAKVGTTTWTKYLLEAGYPGLLDKVTNWHLTAYTFLVPPRSRTSNDTLALMTVFGKVMIVRHPFVRLVSAYIDKIADGSAKRMSSYIIKRYRPRNSRLPVGKPSFKEFVQFLVEVSPAGDDIRAKRPSRIDRHWVPYYANCAPCDIHYDVIAAMETLKEDTRYVIHKYRLGLADDWWMNHHASTSSHHAALHLFQNLPRNLTLALYQRYRIDFLMFGYDLAPYLSSGPHHLL